MVELGELNLNRISCVGTWETLQVKKYSEVAVCENKIEHSFVERDAKFVIK